MSSAEEESVTIVPEVKGSEPPLPLSKSAQKKAAKAARIAASKQERRAREKEARKEKRMLKRAAEELEQGGESQSQPRKRARVSGSVDRFGARLVVDLGFDDKMNDKEVVSLTSQLAYTYSANRKAVCPFEQLLFTSLNGKTFARMESLGDAGYKRWNSTEWWSDGYERLWEGKEHVQNQDSKTNSTTVDKQTVVYLTADSSEELLELKEGETYIVGGICDHNRYKNLCQDKAVSSGIRTARLPIGKYLAQLPTRKVLTVNQVVEILLKWTETKDWEESLYSVMPKRKFHQGKQHKNDRTAAEDDVEHVVVVVDEQLES